MRQIIKYFTGLFFCISICLLLISCAQKRPSMQEQDKNATGNATKTEQEISNATAKKEETKEKEEEQVEEYELREEEKKKLEKEKERKLAKEEATEKIKQRIYFAFDSHQLSSKAREKLKKKAGLLKKYSDINLIIGGHCDERGTEEYNLALGERRAKAAYEFLIVLGIDPSRMSYVSYGEEKPLVQGHNEEAWARNRRAEFRIKSD